MTRAVSMPPPVGPPLYIIMATSSIPEAVKLKKTGDERNLWTRRDFFGFAGWGAFLGALGIGTLAFLRFMFPRVLFEPSPIVKVGRPEDYGAGEVSEKYKDEYRIWIERTEDKIFAILAICTHLGCTPRWLNLEDKFKCPCHGSGFRKSGVNFEGPAPRPLERLKIWLNDEGELLVDKSSKFLWEKGQWEDPQSFVRVS